MLPKTSFTQVGWSFCVVTVSKNNFQKIRLLSSRWRKTTKSRLCTNPLGAPPPSPLQGEKHINAAENVLYIGWMVILCGHNIKKLRFLSCPGEKLH